MKSLKLVLVFALLLGTFAIPAKPVYATDFDSQTAKTSMPEMRDIAVTAVSREIVEDSWRAKAPLPEEADVVMAAVIDGKIHAIQRSAHYVYDPAEDEWVSKRPMPTARAGFGIAVCQNRIYTIGGGIWDSALGWVTSDANEVYDPATDSWESKTAMPTGRMDLSAYEVDGKIYLIAGRVGAPSHLTAALNEVYDVANDSWATMKPIPYPVVGYASAVVDGKIYVIGGQDEFHEDLNVDFNQVYDPSTDSWSFRAPLPEVVIHSGSAATAGTFAPKRIYVFGGEPDWGVTNLTQVYDPYNDSWTFGAQMPTARSSAAVGVVDDLLYAIGGAYGHFPPAARENEQYTPFGYGTVLPPPESEPFLKILVVAIAITVTIVTTLVGFRLYSSKRKSRGLAKD